MDQRLKDLEDWIKEKLGLDQYYLKRSSISRKLNTYQQTKYIYCMEWFPVNIAEHVEDEDLNPEGTASVEVDIHTKKIESLIFVGKTSFANIRFEPHTENIIDWVEKETGINHDQYRLSKQDDNNWQLKASINNISVFPSGQIDVNLNEEGQLLLFSVFGDFPKRDSVKQEVFNLSKENIQDIAYNQLHLIEFPDFQKEKIQQVYGMEEIFIVNKNRATLSYDIGVPEGLQSRMDHLLRWDSGLDGVINRQPVFVDRQVSAEVAYANEPSPDAKPITEEEKGKCIDVVETFMRIEYADDSGQWLLDHLYRDMEMIQAVLRPVKEDKKILRKKLVIMICRETYEVLNYIDTTGFSAFDMIGKFDPKGVREIEKSEAFERIKAYFEVKPYYVYDYEEKEYLLCGMLDCDYYVHAETGEVGLLDDLHC
ncbi:hypothetical protein [Gracilibacillus xinjiangensis]|uniref:DUF4901 domain-containing protein n=1 Tax=Gracilibacillus xinjiangensis TaxID=1193282 RepID=A0ABV8WQP4_9BACI